MKKALPTIIDDTLKPPPTEFHHLLGGLPIEINKTPTYPPFFWNSFEKHEVPEGYRRVICARFHG